MTFDPKARHSPQLCSTPGCNRTASRLSKMCHRCSNRLRRFGAVDQELPNTRELDTYVRRAEEMRGRLKLLDLKALEARWMETVADCRGKATPTYKDQHVLTYNGWEREGAALVRDIGEAIPFTRALDLMTAIILMQIERPDYWKGDEAIQCSTTELMRRTCRVGCMVVAMNNANGTIENSYRREMSREFRKAAFRFLFMGLGAAAKALAHQGRKA